MTTVKINANELRAASFLASKYTEEKDKPYAQYVLIEFSDDGSYSIVTTDSYTLFCVNGEVNKPHDHHVIINFYEMKSLKTSDKTVEINSINDDQTSMTVSVSSAKKSRTETWKLSKYKDYPNWRVALGKYTDYRSISVDDLPKTPENQSFGINYLLLSKIFKAVSIATHSDTMKLTFLCYPTPTLPRPILVSPLGSSFNILGIVMPLRDYY